MNNELRIEDWTRFEEQESPAFEDVKQLLEVGEEIAEVRVLIKSVGEDPWYYSCGACKKACSEVSLYYLSHSLSLYHTHFLVVFFLSNLTTYDVELRVVS